MVESKPLRSGVCGEGPVAEISDISRHDGPDNPKDRTRENEQRTAAAPTGYCTLHCVMKVRFLMERSRRRKKPRPSMISGSCWTTM